MENKVLIGVVTSIYKDYCYKEFSRQLRVLQAQGHDVLIVDNSFCTTRRQGFKTIHYRKNGMLREVLRDCMNIVREEFLKGEATHLMILESDVFIKTNSIGSLLALDADVASFTYPMKLKCFNKQSLCVQLADAHNVYRMITPEESQELINTGVKRLGIDTLNGSPITHVGYGCTLVKRKVLERIEFVTGKTAAPDGRMPFPDSYFHFDVNRYGFSNRLDTDFLPEHRNLMNETENHRQIIDSAYSHYSSVDFDNALRAIRTSSRNWVKSYKVPDLP